MGGTKRTVLIDPISLRRGLKEAIRSFCRDVLVGRELLHADVLDDPAMGAEQQRIAGAIASHWESWETRFEPDDPPTVQSVLESGAMVPAVVGAIDRFCRETLIPAGHLAESSWDSRELDSQKYAIARRVCRAWVSAARIED